MKLKKTELKYQLYNKIFLYVCNVIDKLWLLTCIIVILLIPFPKCLILFFFFFFFLKHWIQSLKPYCVNIQPPKTHHLSVALKELRSLSIEIFDGRELPNKQLPHPYCVVSLNTVQVCRTQVAKCPNPYWGEDFILE